MLCDKLTLVYYFGSNNSILVYGCRSDLFRFPLSHTSAVPVVCTQDSVAVCSRVKFCRDLLQTTIAENLPQKASMPENFLECAVCKEVAEEILELVNKSTTEVGARVCCSPSFYASFLFLTSSPVLLPVCYLLQGDAKVLVERICPYLGGFAKECLSLIDTFWDEIYQNIVKTAGVIK